MPNTYRSLRGHPGRPIAAWPVRPWPSKLGASATSRRSRSKPEPDHLPPCSTMVRSATAGMKSMSNDQQEIRPWFPEEEAQSIRRGHDCNRAGRALGSQSPGRVRSVTTLPQAARPSKPHQRTRLRAMGWLAGGPPPAQQPPALHRSPRQQPSSAVRRRAARAPAGRFATVEATYP
jgi:hypothetical protein